MTQVLPKVIPINELKNTARISKACRDSDVPIIVTKNGYGEMVLMSVELYEQTIAKLQSALLINDSLAEVENGAEPIEGATFFSDMRQRYGK